MLDLHACINGREFVSRKEVHLSRREFLKTATKTGVGLAALGGSQRSSTAQRIGSSEEVPAWARVPTEDALVWAIDDTQNVHPISGNLLSEGLNVYVGHNPSQGTYRKNNPIWDAATQTIKLVAGRNEFVAFQLVIEAGREDLHKVFVNPTDLLGSRERINSDRDIRLFKELYVCLNGEWYPDAIVPFQITGTTPFELPEYSGLLPEQRVQPIWVDIYVPHDLPPGSYTGQINILHANLFKLAILNVELEVGGFTLPDKMGLDVDLMNYGSLNVERGWPDLVVDGKRNRSIEREFFRMAHAHRMTFAIVPYNYDDVIPKGLKPELAGVGETIHVQDWESWDERYGPVLSGEAFADLPRGPQPVAHFMLPFSLMWPADFRSWDRPSYRMETVRIAKEFRDHLAEKGWTKPLYEIYYNDKESMGFVPWELDEPPREKDLETLRTLGGIFQEAFPPGGPARVVFRVDLSNAHNENEIRDAWRILGPLVELWNMYDPNYWANMSLVRKLKSQGKILFFYDDAPAAVEPLIKATYWGWKGYKYEADGFCFWNSTDWNMWRADTVPVDPYTNAGGREGRSVLFYPGYKFGYDGPIPSIRLKALRRGLQDFEYLRLIEQSGKKRHAELVRMADDLLQGEMIGYPKLHRAIFELLAGGVAEATHSNLSRPQSNQ